MCRVSNCSPPPPPPPSGPLLCFPPFTSPSPPLPLVLNNDESMNLTNIYFQAPRSRTLITSHNFLFVSVQIPGRQRSPTGRRHNCLLDKPSTYAVLKTAVRYYRFTGKYRVGFCRASVACLFVNCLTSQQHASVSQGRICSDRQFYVLPH